MGFLSRYHIAHAVWPLVNPARLTCAMGPSGGQGESKESLKPRPDRPRSLPCRPPLLTAASLFVRRY